LTTLESGKRLGPRTITRVADFRPFELQDTLPANSRFKIVAFINDFLSDDDVRRVDAIAKEVRAVLDRYPEAFVNIVTLAKSISETLTYTNIPAGLQPTWERFVHQTRS
jgi:phenol 2-monooxygenase